MLGALAFHLGPSQEIVIAGRRGDKETETMIRAARSQYLPQAVVLFHPDGQRPGGLGGAGPNWAKEDHPAQGSICEDSVCGGPIRDAKAFEAAVRRLGRGR